MPGLVETLNQRVISQYEFDSLDKNEHRRENYGVIDFFIRQTDVPNSLLRPSVRQSIPTSFGKNVHVPVVNHLDADAWITDVRTCVAPLRENTSAMVLLTFATIAGGWRMYPSQYENNLVDYNHDWVIRFNAFEDAIAKKLDNYAIGLLETNKNQVWTPDITNQFAQVGNVLQVPKSGQPTFYNYLKAIMASMNWQGGYHVLANTMHAPEVSYYQAQGQANSANLMFQFGGYDWRFSNNIPATGAGVKSSLFALPDGQVAFVSRLDPDARARRTATDGTQWGQVRLPRLGLDMGYVYKSMCGDAATDLAAYNTGVTGLTASMIESFYYSVDVAFITAYNSDPTTRFQPVVKANFLNA
jgi:hypothetical protein